MAFPFYFVSDGILSFPKESIQRTAFKGRGISIFPFLLSPFCLRRDTFFPWRKKVSKERHLRGEGFRFPSPLKNPLSLKRPKREGCGPPSLETPSRGYAIIKSRLCRAAAKVGGGQGPLVEKTVAAEMVRRGGALPRPKHNAETAGGAEPLPYGRATRARCVNVSPSVMAKGHDTSLTEGGEAAPVGTRILARS